MSQRLVVFISSTVEDLDGVRRALKDQLEARGVEVRLSEDADFPVEPGVSSHDACLRAVRTAHVFVLLVGSRFGGEYQGLAQRACDFEGVMLATALEGAAHQHRMRRFIFNQ